MFFMMSGYFDNLAQKMLTSPNKSSSWEIIGSKKIFVGSYAEAPQGIEFIKGKVKASHFILNMAKHLGIDSGASLHKIKTETDGLGMTHHRFQQKYKGVVMEGLEYRLHERDGHLVSANGRLIMKNIDIEVQPVLSEQQAFQLAKAKVHAWNAEFKSGQLLIVSKDFTFLPESFVLGYQFDITVSVTEQWRVSIDANNGDLINKVNLVNSCNATLLMPYTIGTGTTLYNGSQEIKTELVDTTYRLRGKTDNGVQIETYDLKHDWSLVDNDFTDPDNNFSDENAKAGVSAHWGIEQSLNYFKQQHGRDGIFGFGEVLKSYVHYGKGLSNSYYSYPTSFYFGDGLNDSVPWVSLDIVGHEFTHSVIMSESSLYGYGEMGALNESFADIFAYAIELETSGLAANWTIGESVKEGGLRDLSNPNKTLQPDTYHGQYWDNIDSDAATHTNSGVQNFWFYLLCHGGSGVNDNGLAYQVDSIGVEKATAIAYRNITEYLYYYSRFRDNRFGSLAAAADLYGNSSAEYKAVVNAWEAVGVSDNIKPIIWDVEAKYVSGGMATLMAKLPQNFPVNSYRFEYGTTTAYGSTAYTYLSYYGYDAYLVQANLTGLIPNTHYHFRFAATNANGTSEGTGEFTTTSGEPKIQYVSLQSLTLHSVTIFSTIDTKGIPTSYFVEYGTTPSFGSATPSSYAFPGYYSSTSFNYSYLYNLEPYQNYYYRIIANNSFGADTTATSMFFSAGRPTISNLETTKATVGSEVLIYGTNFNTEPSKNIVHFGAARANVLEASENTLMVEVPIGASLGSIIYTNASSELSAVSLQEFIPIVNLKFSEENLELKATIDGGLSPLRSKIFDLDADYKPDVINLCKGGFSILQNVCSDGSLSDNDFVKTYYPVSDSTTVLDIADMNGDGLKDIVVNKKNGFRLYLNSSTIGHISFGDTIDFDLAKPIGQIACADFDVDGKVDVAVEVLGDSISIYKNQSIKGAFLSAKFSKEWGFPIDSVAPALTAADLNNDGYADLIMGSKNKGEYIFALNYYGSFFIPNLFHNFSQGAVPANFSVHDLNGDDRKDIASAPEGWAGSVLLFHGPFGFNSPIEIGLLSADTIMRMASIADIDGEGTPDLVVGTAPGKFSILLNHTKPFDNLSFMSFEQTKEYGTLGSENGRGIAASDLNGDGKTDLVNITGNGNLIEIWQNTAPNGPACPLPTGLLIDTVNYNSVKISWDSIAPDAQYIVEYKQTSYTAWNASTIISNTQFINYLYPSTEYIARVKRVCGNFSSDFEYVSFSTPCPPPFAYAPYVGQTDASVYLSNQYYIGTYEIEYRVSGGQWQSINGYYGYNYLSGLIPATSYDIRIRSICSSGPSEFVYSTFTTLCPPQLTISIRSITTTSAMVELSPVQGLLKYVTEYSRNGSDWVEVDSTMMLTNLSIGHAYQVRAKSTCGEVQVLFSTLCPTPKSVSVSALNATSAVIQWEDEFDIGLYSVEYTKYGSIDWTLLSETSLFNQAIFDLTPETTYKARVFTICSDKISNRIPIFFTTPVITGLEPDGLTLSPIPVQKELHIHSEENLAGKKVAIVDVTGRVVFHTTLKEQYVLDLSDLSSGVFVVKIENKKPMRIIKE